MRSPRTDWLLWLTASGLLFGAVLAWWASWAGLAAVRPHPDLLPFAVVAIVLGWAAQAGAGECGIGPVGRRPPDQAADYDDRPAG